MNTQEQDDKKTLSALNALFIKNFVTNDAATHDTILHKDFICIENSGEIVGREQYLMDWLHGYDSKVFASFTHGDEHIRIYGNVALVRSKTTYTKKNNGTIVTGYTIYTDIYVKENGRWLCVQAQITPVQ